MGKYHGVIIEDDPDELRLSLEQSMRRHDYRVIAGRSEMPNRDGSRRIFVEFPSDLALLDSITGHVIKRVGAAWSLPDDDLVALNIALSESLINAIKHGNNSEVSKLVRFTIEIAADEARFIVEDEGDGFNVDDIPHPRDPKHLFKPSGRGVLMIKSIMDEAEYNDHGNRLTMIKRRASLLQPMSENPL